MNPCRHPSALVFSLVLSLWAGISSADEVRIKKLSAKEAPIEWVLDQKSYQGWILPRQTLSSRGQVALDGWVLVPAARPLNLQVIRRQDGHHKFFLGQIGESGQPTASFQGRLKDFQRAHLVPRQIISQESKQELAVLYVPHGTHLIASLLAGSLLVEVEIPWDELDPMEEMALRFQKEMP